MDKWRGRHTCYFLELFTTMFSRGKPQQRLSCRGLGLSSASSRLLLQDTRGKITHGDELEPKDLKTLD